MTQSAIKYWYFPWRDTGSGWRGGALTYLWDTDLLTCIQEVLHIPTALSHAELWLEGRTMSNSNHVESLRWNMSTHFLFQNSGRSPLQERARGCWQQIGEKCYWLSGKGRLRPSGRLRHRLGATPSVWTRCSAHRTTMTSLSVKESLLRWVSHLYWSHFLEWNQNRSQFFSITSSVWTVVLVSFNIKV